ncbi:MAG: RluA family pseudouridine synthase [Clostridiales bacterium]|nr:RluA family pseudouridine synthase [Clostridiales bacterium]
MKQVTVTQNDSGQRLDKFLGKAFPAMPHSMLYKAIRKKNIKLNGKRAEISQRLEPGDTIALYLPDDALAPPQYRYDFMSASKKLEILYEDENLMVLDKRPGVLCHPDGKEYNDTLIARVQRYLYENGAYQPEAEHAFTPSLVNRIDRNTGGIVLAAKNAEALRILNEKMKSRQLHKYYLCIVHGRMEKRQDTLKGYLEKNESKNKVFIHQTPAPDRKTILTKYTVLEARGRYSLLEIDLLTGRTHQIRAHLASAGHPLLGDGKYGTNAMNKGTGYKKQALYSYKLTFAFQTDAGILNDLNGKTITVPSVWFQEDFLNGRIADEG